MQNSIVNIESKQNNGFGTGFVIDKDKEGVFILTCKHVVEDVLTPIVQGVEARVLVTGDFVDMAVLYVPKLSLIPLSLAFKCDNLDIEVLGFARFSKTAIQKKYINATLYEKSIELHSVDNNAFYKVRQIKAKDGFNFDRGNSGSPVICKHSGNVIGMVSNKEGHSTAYAINIENLKTIWQRDKLFLRDDTNDERIKHSSLLQDTISFLIIISVILGVLWISLI